MTIWLLAILLLAGVAAVGYTQGAIRVGISTVGLVIAAMLAGPLSRLVRPALSALGMTNPVLLGAIAPFIVFLVVLTAFKIVALTVHKKVDVHYKYKAGDLRLALWERLNTRLGACLGLLNALVYLVLISWVAHAFSYWTVQMESGDTDPRAVRILNRVGRDLQSTGMARVARAVDPLSEVYYEAADLAGLLYQNSLLEARLSRYPGVLTLAERPEFQNIAADKAFAELRLRRAPIREVLDNPNVSAIVKNPEQLKVIWNTVTPDLKDLAKFLKDGTSEKYPDKILGRWFFDVNAAMAAYRKTKPNLPSSEMLKFRRWMTGAFGKTMMIAAPDNSLIIKNLPQLKTPGSTETQNIQGSWKSAGSEYQLAMGSAGERHGRLEAGRLVVAGENPTLVFAAED